VVVLLASLLASGTGITVTCASEVVLMEPYWNPFVSPAKPPVTPAGPLPPPPAPNLYQNLLHAILEPLCNHHYVFFVSPTGTPF